jgi:hypothetical protein
MELLREAMMEVCGNAGQKKNENAQAARAGQA